MADQTPSIPPPDPVVDVPVPSGVPFAVPTPHAAPGSQPRQPVPSVPVPSPAMVSLPPPAQPTQPPRAVAPMAASVTAAGDAPGAAGPRAGFSPLPPQAVAAAEPQPPLVPPPHQSSFVTVAYSPQFQPNPIFTSPPQPASVAIGPAPPSPFTAVVPTVPTSAPAHHTSPQRPAHSSSPGKHAPEPDKSFHAQGKSQQQQQGQGQQGIPNARGSLPVVPVPHSAQSQPLVRSPVARVGTLHKPQAQLATRVDAAAHAPASADVSAPPVHAPPAGPSSLNTGQAAAPAGYAVAVNGAAAATQAGSGANPPR